VSNPYAERDKLIRELDARWWIYQDYLRSVFFSYIRQAVFDRDGGNCRICRKSASDVHHFQYDRETMLGETLDHLISLCGSCHHDVEFKDGKRVWVQNTRERFNELKK